MRKLFCHLSLLGAFCVAMCLSGGVCLAQSPIPASHPLVSADVYGRILDAVFALKKEKPSDLQYSMVLRFMSSSRTESEVAVNVFNGGKTEAMLFTVAGTGIWNTANEYIQRTGGVDVEQIAKLVQTTRQEVLISPVQAGLWHARVLKSLAQSSVELQQDFIALKKTGETTISLDGSTYELWFSQGSTDVHWVVMDEEVNDSNVTGRSSIAKWMNEVRRYSFDHIAK